MQVLDKGKIELVNFMGNDFAVVAAARVSNGVSYEEASKGPEADQKLINYLMKHRHGSPFEHVVYTFYVKAPIFVVREWMRHRIGSYNEISGRYVEFKPEFYIPIEFRRPAATNKQGSIFPPPTIETILWDDLNTRIVQDAVRDSFSYYQWLLSNNVAKEMARMVLPLNLYTEFYWTVNARALMNFLSLRTGEDAQYEIRMYAEKIKTYFKEGCPMIYQAWETNNFLAP